MNVSNMEVDFGSDLKHYGYNCDGQSYVGEVFYVSITDKQGNRWRHNRYFDGVQVHYDDETGENYFEDTRDQAKEQCRKIVNRIVAAGRVNLAHWSSDRPAYGSEAYQDYGMHDDLVWEKNPENW